MSEDGIAFGAYDPITDSCEAPFIEDFTLDELANRIHELIAEYDDFSLFQDQLLLWDKRRDQQIAEEDEWCERRKERERLAITQGRLLDEAAGPPELGWCFERFRYKDLPADPANIKIETAIMLGAWFPPELCSHNCPEAERPLPPPRGCIELCAKYAALSAIHDYRMKGQQKIGAGLDLKHFDLLLGIKSPAGERDGLVAQIPKADECHLWTWIGDIERDLQARAVNGAAGQQSDPAGPTPSDPVALEAGERPDDLMTLKAVRKVYRVSDSTLRRHIREGKLTSWRKPGNLKHEVSEAAVKTICVAYEVA